MFRLKFHSVPVEVDERVFEVFREIYNKTMDKDHAEKYYYFSREFYDSTSPIIIGKNCWIGAGTIILRGTVIGDNCIVGAGGVLHGSYPSDSFIVQKRDTSIKQTVKK